MSAEGWIKLHRKLQDNPLWSCEKFTRGQAWVDIILLANHSDSFFYKRGIKIDLKRGQCARSVVELADRWKWSRTKVKKFLNDLEKEQQIVQQKSNVTQILTLVNYKEYQKKEQQTLQQKCSRSAAERHIQECKEGEEGKETTPVNGVKTPYKEIVDYLNAESDKDFKHTTKATQRLIKARFNEGFTLPDFKAVIESKTKEWQYDNEMVTYIRPSTLFGNKFESYLQASDDAGGDDTGIHGEWKD